MEKYILENDIVVFCITATSFPDGVMAVHEKLDEMVPFSIQRKYFGLSRPNEKGVIVYKSAATELGKGELAKLDMEELVIKKGNYISILVPDFKNNLSKIGEAFQQLIAQPDIDPQGWCVECILKNEMMRCMVRLKS